MTKTKLFSEMKMIKENKFEILLTVLYILVFGFLFFSVFSCNQKSAKTKNTVEKELPKNIKQLHTIKNIYNNIKVGEKQIMVTS